MLSSMAITIHESGYRQGTRAVVPESKGQRILVRLMGWEPGTKTVEGSSADYPVERIVRDFGEAFPIGTRMRANHDGFCEAGGDIRRIMAKTVTAPEQREDGMYSWAVMKEGEPSDFIRQFADAIGTSVSVGVEPEVEHDEDGQPLEDEDGRPVYKRSERGAMIVNRFLPMSESPYNAVDFVEAPGADGAIVELAMESAKEMFNHVILKEDVKFAIDLAGDPREATKTSEASPPRNTQKENSMDPKEIEALLEKAASAAVTKYAESQRPEAAEQPTLSAMAESIVKAGLSEAGRGAVYARVERGEGLEAAIAAETQREADIQAEVDRRVEAELAKRSESSSFGGGFGYSDDKTGKPLGTESERETLAAHESEFEAAMSEEG